MTHSKKFFSRAIILTALMLLFPVVKLSSQENKNFYLLDSLDITKLSKYDKRIMDSILTLYHKASHDTTKLHLLDFLSTHCSETIYPLYSDFIAKRAVQLLSEKKNMSAAEINFLKAIVAGCALNKGMQYASKGDYDKAMECYQKSKEDFEEVGDKKGIAVANSNIGTLYNRQNKVDEALDYFQKSIPLLKELNDTEALINNYNGIASIYSAKGEFEKAIEYWFNGLKLNEKEEGELRPLVIAHIGIGNAYYRLGELETALKHYTRGLEMSERIAFKNGIAKTLDGLALIYKDKGEFEKALETSLRSLKIKEEIGAKQQIAFSYNLVAMSYHNLKNYAKAEESYLKSIKLAEEVNARKDISNTSKNLATLYFEQNKLDKAKQYGLKALEVANELKFPENIQKAADLLNKVYAKQNNWKVAYEMNALASKMRDSLNNEKNTKALLKKNYEYEYDKKETELKAQTERESLLAAQRHEKQQIIIWSAVAGLILVIIFTLILFNRLRVTRTQKDIIDKKNKENELLLAEIHHRVKNNLQVISSLLNMQERNIENEKARSAIMESKERVRSMELIHKMLYRENFFSGVEMREYLKTLTNGLTESFNLTKEKDVEVNLNFEPLTIDVDTAVPLGLILNELIVNSFKYATSATEKLILKIALNEQEGQLNLSLSDNGKGKKSEVENSNSFGLRIIKALVKQLNGVMEISEQNGLNYNITLKTIKTTA